jgi:hypothetical protein
MKIVKIIIVVSICLGLTNCNSYLNYQKANANYNNSKYKRFDIDKTMVQAAVNKFVATYQLKTPFNYIDIQPIENDIEVTIRTADNLVYAALFDTKYKFLFYRQILE